MSVGSIASGPLLAHAAPAGIHNLDFHDVPKRFRAACPKRRCGTVARGQAMNDIFNHAFQWMNRLDRQDWMLVLIAAVILGFLCLRGFGSRTNY
jgi:hypothetical protein